MPLLQEGLTTGQRICSPAQLSGGLGLPERIVRQRNLSRGDSVKSFSLGTRKSVAYALGPVSSFTCIVYFHGSSKLGGVVALRQKGHSG